MISNPEKAIRKLSWPLTISLLITALYNLIDGFWASGLGLGNLAGIEYITPLFLGIVGISKGLKIGVASAISKYIGNDDKKKADNAAAHAIILAIIISLFLTITLLLFMHYLLISMKIGKNIHAAQLYGNIIFLGSILFIIPHVIEGIFISEGNSKRIMYLIILSSILNLILDPFFAYTLNLGVRGIAEASVLSLVPANLMIIYLFYIKKDTYLRPTLTNFKLDYNIIKDILKVGIPSSLDIICEAVGLAVLIFLIGMVLSNQALTNEISIHKLGFNIITLGSIFVTGISTTLVSIIATNVGAKSKKNINKIYKYSIKLCLIISILIFLIIFIFSEEISTLLAYNIHNPAFFEEVNEFLYFIGIILVFQGISEPCIASFEGLGNGFLALLQRIFKQIFIISISYFFIIVIDSDVDFVHIGIILGELLIALISYRWSKIKLSNINFDNENNNVDT